MKAPYHPAHVERVQKPPNREIVLAACSCGWKGPFAHKLGNPSTCRRLIADFNAHRAEYAHRDPV